MLLRFSFRVFPSLPVRAARVSGWLLAALGSLLLLPLPTQANTSNSLLDVSPDGSRLLTANTDNWSVTVVDTAANMVLREIKVGRRPEGVTWIGKGPLAAVTCYFDNQVMIVDTEAGKVVETFAVDPEPYGIVADKEGKRAWVTHEYPALVSEIDLAARKVVRKLPAGAFLRGIALSPDEKRLYVTEFYSARLLAIDLASGKVVDSWKGHSTDNLCRHVLLHPRRPKAYLSHIRSMIKVIDGGGSIFPHVTVCDLKPGSGSNRTSSFAMDTYNGVYVVTNAWEADMTPDGKYLYTIYAGTNDMNISRVIDDDYREIEPVGRAVRVGSNPRAVRVSPDGSKVYVYNALDFAVDVRRAESLSRLATIKVCAPPKSPEWVRGKVLFNTANYPMSSRRWVACSSCHPDGHSDGRAWHNPEGLRRTTALFGAAHTHPLHWSGDRDEAQDFEYTIRSPLMRGGGLFRGSIRPKLGFAKIELEQKTSGLSKDLDALAIYTNSFEFLTLSPHIAAPGKLLSAAERGKQLFVSKEVGCVQCHSGPYYTDSSLKKPYKLHDVGTVQDDPEEKMGPLYDTPTLLGIYRQLSYLHHGKAKSLREVLTTYNHQDKHGKTSHLTPAQVDDLVAFLRSLPYETPPTVTENTVPYRFVPGKKE
jgi:YVTN family beta-propeller protein